MDKLSIILVIGATIINSIVFGYVASNSKNNKTNFAYLIFLGFIILYTIFDCIIIQIFSSKTAKDFIVLIQAALWMPLSILFLNFTYSFLRKKRDQIFYILSIFCFLGIGISLFSNKVLLGFKDYNVGTMAFTGPLFLPIVFLFILPGAMYSLFLIAKEGQIFSKKTNQNIEIDSFLKVQLNILFFGSLLVLVIGLLTNIFFDEVLGFSGELHLASLSLSIQSIFLLPALIKYNFLNKPMETLGDELYANSADAVFIINKNGIIRNLNQSARNFFQLKGQIVNLNIVNLFKSVFSIEEEKDNYELVTKLGKYVTITQTHISRGKQYIGDLLVVRDISSRIDAENRLLKSEDSYKNLVETSGDIIYNIDIDGNFTYVNKVFEHLSGYKKEEVLGKNSVFMVRDDYKKLTNNMFHSFFEKGTNTINKKIKFELPALMKSGEELWMEIGVTTIIKESLINGFSIISRDITDRKNAEIKLAKIAEELTIAQNIAGLGSFTYDVNKDLVIWSDKLYEIYGKDKNIFVPSSDIFFDEIVHPDSREQSKKIVADAVENKDKKIDYIHKTLMNDGGIKWFHAIIDVEYDKNKNVTTMNGTSQDITQIYTYQEELRRLSSHIQNLQEEERTRIAHEIHDELGQRLTSINMDVSFLKTKLITDKDSQITNRLNELDVLVDETINITRKISQELRPSILDNLGLTSALEWLQNQYSKRSNLNFSFNKPKNELKIKGEQATTIFRITQEALTNIIRHAEASNVIVDLKIKNKKVQLNIKDDGRGININDEIERPRFGLLGMRERAASLGGKLDITSNKKNGTTINLILPESI